MVIKKKFFRKVGIEACWGAHFIGAPLCDQGHHVRLILALFLKPVVKSPKNDPVR